MAEKRTRRTKEQIEADKLKELEANGSIMKEAPEAPEEVVETESPWKVMALQSDKDVTVEACGVVGYQSAKGALIRYRVGGKIIGKVEFLPMFTVKVKDGIWQLR